jgi:probable F420-dependent oxidoreductase
VKFWTSLPGLSRWPPASFSVPGANWQEHLSAPDFQRIAADADRLGFDAISVPEHVVLPRELAGHLGGRWPDALTVMAFIAGATTRIRVNSGVIIAPLHNPVRLAKAIATLDVLSGGRVMVTFGAGMAPGEFSALGVDFSRRGRMMDEYIRAMKVLWTADEPEFHGEFVDFADVVFEPKPVQRPHPPVFVGGRSVFALRRAARLADGWAPSGAQGGTGPWLEGPSDLPRFLAEARRCEGFEQRERAFDIAMHAVPVLIGPDHRLADAAPRLTSTQQVIDLIADLDAAGVTWTTVPPLADGPQSLADHAEYLEWATAEVMPAVRRIHVQSARSSTD